MLNYLCLVQPVLLTSFSVRKESHFMIALALSSLIKCTQIIHSTLILHHERIKDLSMVHFWLNNYPCRRPNPIVTISPCQLNFIKKFQVETLLAVITKTVFIFAWDLAKHTYWKVQKSDFQSQFSMSKILWIFLKQIFIEKYQFRSNFLVFINFVYRWNWTTFVPKISKKICFFWQLVLAI